MLRINRKWRRAVTVHDLADIANHFIHLYKQKELDEFQEVVDVIELLHNMVEQSE